VAVSRPPPRPYYAAPFKEITLRAGVGEADCGPSQRRSALSDQEARRPGRRS
jgi:hypothetical protein